MFYQSSGRNQRPKGFKVKQTFQVILFLAVCIWLLYQIKNSYYKVKDNGGNVQKKLSSEHGSMVLGRKGNAGSSDGVEIDSNHGNPMGEGGKKDGGGGDDELDRNVDERAEEESFHQGHENSQENINNFDKKGHEKDPKTQHKEPLDNEEHYSSTQSIEGNKPVGSDKDKGEEESLYQGPEDEKDNPDTKVTGRDGAVDSGKDKDTKESAEEIALQHNEMENTTVSGQSEMGDGVHSFHDENGVPQDGQDLVSTNETSYDQATAILDQETISSSDNRTQLSESTSPTAEKFSNSSQASEKKDTKMPIDGIIVERGEIKSQEGSSTSEVKTASNSTQEVRKTDSSDDRENGFPSGNFDESSTKGSSGTMQVTGIILEDSKSVPSQQKQEQATGIKMLPQAENEVDSKE